MFRRNAQSAAVTCIKDPQLRHTVAILLKHQGYRVFETDDPAEGLRVLKQQTPEVAVVGEIADRDGTLRSACADRKIRCITLAPNHQIAELFEIFQLT